MEQELRIYDQEANDTVGEQTTFDYMVRIREADSSEFKINIASTEEFKHSLLGIFQENIVLKESLNYLWQTHQYNQEYIAYLLGSYSDKEFREIAETYAEPTKEDMSGDQLIIVSNIICSTLNMRLNTTDLSVLLNVTPSYIEQNIKLLDYTPEACESE